MFADDSIDGVLIQTGPLAHPQLVQAAARAGKHIFVEKPIGLELEEALETVRVVEEAGVKFIFGTCQRLGPNPKMAKRMCPHPLYSYCQCAADITSQARPQHRPGREHVPRGATGSGLRQRRQILET